MYMSLFRNMLYIGGYEKNISKHMYGLFVRIIKRQYMFETSLAEFRERELKKHSDDRFINNTILFGTPFDTYMEEEEPYCENNPYYESSDETTEQFVVTFTTVNTPPIEWFESFTQSCALKDRDVGFVLMYEENSDSDDKYLGVHAAYKGELLTDRSFVFKKRDIANFKKSARNTTIFKYIHSFPSTNEAFHMHFKIRGDDVLSDFRTYVTS